VIVATTFGLRRTLIFGTILSALQFPAIAFVQGVGPAMILFGIISSLGQVFYWTCYHVFFASLGDVEHRGEQIGARQAISAVAGVVAPAAGGILLTNFGPWIAFGTAFAIQIVAVYPLLHVEELKVTQPSPRGALTAAKVGILLFFMDGWIQSGSTTAWTIIMFKALAERFDNFGGVLAVAALGGALGGVILGRYIDMGHARRTVLFNAVILALGLIIKSFSAGNPVAVIGISIGTALFSGLYFPYWMTAVYNAAKIAPCTFRFQFASEGGWDLGGVIASLVAAVVCAANLSIEVIIMLALPMVALQALMVDASYRQHNHADDNRLVQTSQPVRHNGSL
jgi:MFS family permease